MLQNAFTHIEEVIDYQPNPKILSRHHKIITMKINDFTRLIIGIR